MSEKTPPLTGAWNEHLGAEFEQGYMSELRDFLKLEKHKGHTIYPKSDDMFNAFNYTPFEQVKVVVLGQDPYHGPEQAHGLSFSVLSSVKTPPSLVNIFREVANDTKQPFQKRNGCLESWAQQGVLLLNCVMSVRAGAPASHSGKGWEKFTDKAIEVLNAYAPNGIVFMLWGRYAKQKVQMIDPKRHKVLTAAHPSPFSVRGFFGCSHFSIANNWLADQGLTPIDWQL